MEHRANQTATASEALVECNARSCKLQSKVCGSTVSSFCFCVFVICEIQFCRFHFFDPVNAPPRLDGAAMGSADRKIIVRSRSDSLRLMPRQPRTYVPFTRWISCCRCFVLPKFEDSRAAKVLSTGIDIPPFDSATRCIPGIDSIHMTKAALYARVSSDAQQKEGTIESQVAELKRQIAAAGHVLVKEYIDDGVPGPLLEPSDRIVNRSVAGQRSPPLCQLQPPPTKGSTARNKARVHSQALAKVCGAAARGLSLLGAML
jgi:hypothetical protein